VKEGDSVEEKMFITEDGVVIPLNRNTDLNRIATAIEKLVSLLEKEIEYWEEVDEDDEEIEGQMELEFEEHSQPKPSSFSLIEESSRQIDRMLKRVK